MRQTNRIKQQKLNIVDTVKWASYVFNVNTLQLNDVVENNLVPHKKSGEHYVFHRDQSRIKEQTDVLLN